MLAPESRITVRTFKADPQSRLTHEHVVEGVDFSGSATYDPNEPKTLSLEVTVDATTLRIDADEARQRLGLPLDISAANRLAIQETLLGPETLHVKRYPQIKFKSKSYTQKDGIWWLTGDLTLHGVTQRVDIPTTVTLNGERLTGSAVFTIQTSAYRITPYSAFLGAIAVKDEVEMRLELVGASIPAPARATNAAPKTH